MTIDESNFGKKGILLKMDSTVEGGEITCGGG